MKIVCAWCKKDLGEKPGPASATSHGICETCARNVWTTSAPRAPRQRTPPNICPACGHRCNAVDSPFTDKMAEPGDISLCIACACAMVFNSDMTIHAATQEEIDDLNPESRAELLRLIESILATRASLN